MLNTTMDRRNFLCGVGATAASSAALEGASRAIETQHVTWNVKGFTCITCAVGLEVMLRGLKGVSEAKASYTANNVTVGYDRRSIDEKKVQEFIASCGFSVCK